MRQSLSVNEFSLSVGKEEKGYSSGVMQYDMALLTRNMDSGYKRAYICARGRNVQIVTFVIAAERASPEGHPRV